MLRNKSTKVFSETNSFFTSTEKGIFRIMELYRTLKLDKLKIGATEKPQSTFQKGDLLLELFPLYSIPNVYSYCNHSLDKSLEARKNTFYRFKNDFRINWRSIVRSCNRALFKQIEEVVPQNGSLVKCLIIDDTDFEKSTYRIEHVGKNMVARKALPFLWFQRAFPWLLGRQEFFLFRL